MTTKRDLYGSYRFWVEIGQLAEGAFSECSGLQAETEVFEWEEGGGNGYKLRLPARTKFPNLVLKRGVASAELWEWYQSVIDADGRSVRIQRRNCSIILYGYSGVPELRWNVSEALPIKWGGPTLKTGANEIAVETIELIHHGFKRVK